MSFRTECNDYYRESKEEWKPPSIRTNRLRNAALFNRQLAVHILDFVNLSDIAKVARVCKELQKMTETPLLWKNITERTIDKKINPLLASPYFTPVFQPSSKWKYELQTLTKKWNEGYQQGLEEGPLLVRIEFAIYSLALTALLASWTLQLSQEFYVRFGINRPYVNCLSAGNIFYMVIKSIFEEVNYPINTQAYHQKNIKIFFLLWITHNILEMIELKTNSKRNFQTIYSEDDANKTTANAGIYIIFSYIRAFLMPRCKKYLEKRSIAMGCIIRTFGYRFCYHFRYSKPFRVATVSCLAIAAISSQTSNGIMSKLAFEWKESFFLSKAVVVIGLVPTSIILGKEAVIKVKPARICQKITRIPRTIWTAITQCFRKSIFSNL